MLSVFISSTSEDLKQHRKVVESLILGAQWHPVSMEHFPSDPRRIVQLCREEVGKCDLVILIQAFRRGWVPRPDQGGDGNTSVTGWEIKGANDHVPPIPVLSFLADDSWPRKLCDLEPDAVQWVERFRGDLHRTAKFFPWEQEPLSQFRALVRESLAIYRDAITTPASQPSELLSESEAYHLLSNADSCATFEGAKVLLDRINPSQFTDPDLVTCIVFSKDLVEFCLMAGVPRDSSDHVSSFWAMMQEVNLPALIRHVLREGVLKTLGTAFRIRRQLNQYPDMMLRLSQKYGPAEVAGRLPG